MEYSNEEKEQVLLASGWHTLWANDNWVHISSKDPDRSGCSLEQAFETFLARQRFEKLFS